VPRNTGGHAVLIEQPCGVKNWHALLGQLFRPDAFHFLPHKIFLLEKNGIYLDSFYPIPCEHLFGGPQIVGRTIRDLLPYHFWKEMKNALAWVSKHRQPRELFYKNHAPNSSIQTTWVTILPFGEKYLIFAKDYTQDGYPVVSLDTWNPAVLHLQREVWPEKVDLLWHG
jgi:hypothetical protein